MNTKQLLAVALAGLLVSAGAVAAVPGSAPDSAQADEHADDADENADDDADDADENADDNASDGQERASENRPDDVGPNADGNESNESDQRGPTQDMPEQAPDHVSQIHDTIVSWLNGDLDGNLGSHVSDIVSGNGDENADNADNGGNEGDEGNGNDDGDDDTPTPSPDETTDSQAAA